MTRKIAESLFSSILYLFSSTMLILSLLLSIKLNAISDEVKRTENEIRECKKENALLYAELEGLTSMDALVEYAEETGMIKCSQENAETLRLAEING